MATADERVRGDEARIDERSTANVEPGEGRAILFGSTRAETEKALWAARSVYTWAEQSRSQPLKG